MPNRQELIDEIRLIQDELKDLIVPKEYFNFRRMSEEDLNELLIALGEQLERRKRFLGAV